MPLRFRFRWIPLIAATLVAAIGISLGQWQTGRAREKEAIEAKLVARSSAAPVALTAAPQEIDALEYRRVTVRGTFVPAWTIYLDNRPHNGIPGFHVLTPFRIEGSQTHVLVARGWVRRDPADRTRLPQLVVPEGVIGIEGRVRRHAGHLMQLGSPAPLTPQAIVQNVEPEELAQASGLAMQPFIVEQSGDLQDGLIRDWPSPSLGIDKHRGYAFQWYALAVTAIVFFIVTGFKRGRQQAEK